MSLVSNVKGGNGVNGESFDQMNSNSSISKILFKFESEK